MNKQDIIRLLGYINGLDPLITCDAMRIDAWDDLFRNKAPHLSFPEAKRIAAEHYVSTTKSIRPKDILDAKPATPIVQLYRGGLKPLCGKCDEGYITIPLPPNSRGFVFNHVDLCHCQWDGPPKEEPNPEYLKGLRS